MKEMGVDPTQAGFMVSSALFGMMFGAIFLGTIADKIGRRWAIAICIGLFLAWTHRANLVRLWHGNESRFERARLLYRLYGRSRY